jgi:hypothetical protein
LAERFDVDVVGVGSGERLVAFGPTAAVLIDHSGKYKIKIVFIVFLSLKEL